MKTAAHFLAMTLIATTMTSCLFGGGSSENENDLGIETYSNEMAYSNNRLQQEQDFAANNNGNTTQNSRRALSNDLVMKSVKDPKNGMTVLTLPLPQNWRLNPNQEAPIAITAPNNVKVNKTEVSNYAYANDRFGQQTIAQMGTELAAPVSLETILKQHIVPTAQAQGYRLKKNYAMPKYQQQLTRTFQSMYNSGFQREIYTMGTEWEGKNGLNSFIVLLQIINKTNGMLTWQLQTIELEAPAASFESAKDIYRYAIENAQVNPQWIQMKNQEAKHNKQKNDAYYAQQSRISNANHQQRMANIRAAGETSRRMAASSSAALDASYNSYMERSESSYASNNDFINTMTEHQNVTNTSTGQQYQVDGFDNNVWMNSDNEYISTDNSLYNPNSDSNVNNQDWNQMEVDNGNW